jgi:hypothetical protein
MLFNYLRSGGAGGQGEQGEKFIISLFPQTPFSPAPLW